MDSLTSMSAEFQIINQEPDIDLGEDKGKITIGMKNGEVIDTIVDRSLFDLLEGALQKRNSGTITFSSCNNETRIIMVLEDISYAKFQEE